MLLSNVLIIMLDGWRTSKKTLLIQAVCKPVCYGCTHTLWLTLLWTEYISGFGLLTRKIMIYIFTFHFFFFTFFFFILIYFFLPNNYLLK